MSKKVNRKAIVIIVAVVAVISIISGTLAWFVTDSSLSQKFSVGGIKVSADVYFDNNGTKVSSNEYKDENGLYNLSLNKKDANYIGNLRVCVKKTGSKSLLRVKMIYEWTNADGEIVQYKVSVPYKFNQYWFDNRDNDYCVYYQGKDKSGKADFTSYELIEGFNGYELDKSGFTDGTSVRALIEIDAVEVNRYPQIWNIEKLPWD
ncbi:MAG: hypothetical protein KBT46_07390 [Ruminococcus sp.]|nr:hypothetical protein [Candidatus Copronaster equi]